MIMLLKNKNDVMKDLLRVTNHKVQAWKKEKIEDEQYQVSFTEVLFKEIGAQIIPQTAKLQRGQVENIVSNTTHKIVCRYEAGKDITQDMYIIFRNKKFDINYILNPYFNNEWLELFCQEVIE